MDTSCCDLPLVERLFKYEGKIKPYKVFNFLAALGHLVNAILSVTLSSDTGKEINFHIQRTYVAWEKIDCNSTNQTFDETSYGFQEFVITPASTEEGFKLNLMELIVSFHALSFVFQSLTYFTNYDEAITDRGVNPLRFFEYSLSASIMLVCIALISNIVLLPSIIGLFFMSFATMILGGIAESLFDDYFVDSKSNSFNGDSDVVISLRRIGWIAHFTGWITLVAAYGAIIFDDFVLSVDKSGVELPWFVPFIVIGIFCFYNVFGLLQFAQLCLKDLCMRTARYGEVAQKGTRECNLINNFFTRYPNSFGRAFCCCFGEGCGREGPDMSVNEFVEFMFVFNSLTTKTILGWVIISNLLGDEQMTGGALPRCTNITNE